MRKIALFMLSTICLLLMLPQISRAEPRVRAEGAVLIDGYTGEILWEKNARQLRHPASTVKMLTTLIALEQVSVQERVTVGKNGDRTSVGQTIGLNRGDILTVADLIKAALLWSANDAAVALAEHMTGDPKLFVLLMNQKAWAIGAFQSSFRNPNGYSAPGQYSTAYDLALMAREAMGNRFFRTTVGQQTGEISWLNKNQTKTVVNTNRLLHDYSWANGVKTGTTDAAGGCLVASAVRDGKWFITAVLGSSQRYADSISLFDYAFENYGQIALKPGDVYDRVKVKNGQSDLVEVTPASGLYYSFPAAAAPDWKIKTDLNKYVRAPVKQGQILGTVQVYYRERLMGKTDLIAGETVKRAGWLRFFHR